MAIPVEALITEDKNYFVLKLIKNQTDYQLKKVAVKIGEKNEKFAEIFPTNEVNNSTKILTKGAFELY
jgi:cobalt-zinc-cadmium efflux system membrane fusion protein